MGKVRDGRCVRWALREAIGERRAVGEVGVEGGDW